MMASDWIKRLAVVGDQRRHAHLRIDGAKFRPPVVAAVLDQMNGRRLVGQAFEIERDAHAIRRRRTEIGIELHVVSAASSRYVIAGRIVLPRADFGDELRRTVGQLPHRAIERFAVGRRQNLGEPAGEVERVRRHFLVHRAAGRR